MFVAAAGVFIVLLYLMYLFCFPINSDDTGSKLFELYNSLMVFSIISGILVMCQLMSGARRIEALNAQFGLVVKR